MVIKLVDFQGQPIQCLCRVDIVGPNGPICAKVKTSENGTYLAKYTPLNLVAGEYVMSVILDSQTFFKYLIKTSLNSTELNIINLADVDQCSIETPGLEEFIVYVRDFNDQPTNGKCEVFLTGPDGPVNVEVEDNGDASYRVKYPSLNS